jgi:hypothetical protein
MKGLERLGLFKWHDDEDELHSLINERKMLEITVLQDWVKGDSKSLC